MNPEQDNFQPLRRLLVLKRYEQPSAGYFDTFSTQVIARIRAGEPLANESILDWVSWDAPWLQRLLAALEAKPLVAGAFAMGICGMLVAGVVFSEKADNASFAIVPPGQNNVPIANLAATPAPNPLFEQPTVTAVSSTAGVLAEPGRVSLFQPFKPEAKPLFERASGTVVVPVGN